MKASTFRLSFLLALALAASLRAAPLISTATFQQGDGGYTGSFDRKISPNGAVDVDGAAVDTDTTSYFLDGGTSALNDTGARHGLLRFENIVGPGAVPSGAKVISATVDTVTNNVTDAQSGGTFNLYRLNTAFDSNSTWAAPFGGDGLTGDVGEILGSFDRPALGQPVSARADKTVQSWVDGAANLGFGIRSDRTTDGWSLNTTGASTVANRPKLTVNYTLDPLVEIANYQNGVNGYSGTTDLRPDSGGSDVDGSTVQEVFLDGFDPAASSPDQSYLIRFEGLNLNYREIYRAELVLVSGFSSANADSPGPFSVHQMLQDWSTSTTYASLDRNGDTTVNDVTELQTAGTIGAAAVSATGMNDTEVMHLDVTSIVENWRAGQANYGIFIGTPTVANGGTANGWQIFTSGASDPSFRPELRIIGILIPEPATMTILVAAAFLAPSIQRCVRKRSGHDSPLL
jgi:hypothetical protein